MYEGEPLTEMFQTQLADTDLLLAVHGLKLICKKQMHTAQLCLIARLLKLLPAATTQPTAC